MVPGTFNWASNISMAILVSASSGGTVTGRLPDRSCPRLVVACKICLAMLEFCGVNSGSPGRGPGDLLGDAKEGATTCLETKG